MFLDMENYADAYVCMYVCVARVSTHPRQKLRDYANAYFSHGESFQYVFRSFWLVMRRGMMFGKVVRIIVHSSVPINLNYFVYVFLFHPMVSHIPCFTSFRPYIFVCKWICSIVIGFYSYWLLVMPDSFKSILNHYFRLCIVKQAAALRLSRGAYNMFQGFA